MRALSVIFAVALALGVNSTFKKLRRMRSSGGGNYGGGGNAGAAIINASPVNTNVAESMNANAGVYPAVANGGYDRGYIAGINAYLNSLGAGANINKNVATNLNLNSNSAANLNLNLNSLLGGNLGGGNINLNGNLGSNLNFSGSPGTAFVTINGVNVPLSGLNLNVNNLIGGSSSSSAAAAAGFGSAAASAFPGNSGSIDLGSDLGSSSSLIGSTQSETLLGLKRN